MEQSESILLKKVKIEVLENDIRVLKEEIAKERGEHIKHTGYVILSNARKEMWSERQYIGNIDIRWVDNEKSHWTEDGIWQGEYELRNWSGRYLEPDRCSWLADATVFKTKEVAEFILKKIRETWGDRWHVYDMRQLKEIMINEPRYINSKASKVL